MIGIIECGFHGLTLLYAVLIAIFRLIQDSSHVYLLTRTVDGTVQEYLGMRQHPLGFSEAEPVTLIHIRTGIITGGKGIKL